MNSQNPKTLDENDPVDVDKEGSDIDVDKEEETLGKLEDEEGGTKPLKDWSEETEQPEEEY